MPNYVDATYSGKPALAQLRRMWVPGLIAAGGNGNGFGGRCTWLTRGHLQGWERTVSVGTLICLRRACLNERAQVVGDLVDEESTGAFVEVLRTGAESLPGATF